MRRDVAPAGKRLKIGAGVVLCVGGSLMVEDAVTKTSSYLAAVGGALIILGLVLVWFGLRTKTRYG